MTQLVQLRRWQQKGVDLRKSTLFRFNYGSGFRFKTIGLLLLLFALPILGSAQIGDSGNLEEFEPFVGNSKYVVISAGIGSGKFRDFATSPLFYTGLPIIFSFELMSSYAKREVSTGVSMMHGNYVISYNDQTAASSVQSPSIYHSRLYRVISTNRWNVKVGGELNVRGNFRSNPSLLNNAVGLEAFSFLYGSLKITKDLTRQTPRRNNREPKQKSLSLRLNASLLGGGLRNDYSYTIIAPALNESVNKNISETYHVVGTTSLTANLDYTIWLKNKNSWRFSYVWDALKTRQDRASFEMANHTLRVALLFNRKNN